MCLSGLLPAPAGKTPPQLIPENQIRAEERALCPVVATVEPVSDKVVFLLFAALSHYCTVVVLRCISAV